ncbi:MAG: hypothetical protein Q7K26_05685 [bacterium]|nr:hypothetical protein [bacterium]
MRLFPAKLSHFGRVKKINHQKILRKPIDFKCTVQEEFLNYHKGLLLDCDAFNSELMDWLIWYNTKRVHYAFDNKMTPVQFLLSWKPSETLATKLPAECKSGWPYTGAVERLHDQYYNENAYN